MAPKDAEREARKRHAARELGRDGQGHQEYARFVPKRYKPSVSQLREAVAERGMLLEPAARPRPKNWNAQRCVDWLENNPLLRA